MNEDKILKSSFRDNSGFVFKRNNTIFRQVNLSYEENFKHLISSGLYSKLIELGLLIPHEETQERPISSEAFIIIKPVEIPFISYPYEWSFSQLKDAALTTLKIQSIALDYGMHLKDASAYNIQFYNLNPVLIDSLSFEINKENQPWEAYRQFCQHFLAPLVLMSYRDVKMNQLLRVFLDGIPLDFVVKLLPFKAKFSFNLFIHLFLHAKMQKNYEDKGINTRKIKYNLSDAKIIIDNLRSAIKGLEIKGQSSEWINYYSFSNYSDEAFEDKKSIVEKYIDLVKPSTAIDLGANNGVFSRIACKKGVFTISCDYDPLAIELNYLQAKKTKEKLILPLIIDLTNPSPAIGWDNSERFTFNQRVNTDIVIALALIHHLAISNNLPFSYIGEYLKNLGQYLIIEFIPKSDSQVKKLLLNRKDIFIEYSEEYFEKEFNKFFRIESKYKVTQSDRIIYLMKKI